MVHGHQVIDGPLGIGTLTGFLLYGVAIGASLGTIAGLYGQFREGTGAIERVFEIIDTRPTILDAPDARPLGPVTGRIELDDVSFAYAADRLVLRDVSLHVPAGETLALVGPSGSGKTTLVGLIPRLWDVTSRHDPHRRDRHPRRHGGEPPRPDRPRRPGGDAVRRARSARTSCTAGSTRPRPR